MGEAISRYLLAMDELNTLVTASYRTAEDAIQVIDDVLSFLVNAYRLGIKNASIMLGFDLEVDVLLMEEAICLLIDGKDFRDRVLEHIENKDLTGLQTLVSSEFHRVYNTAVTDGARRYSSKGDLGIVKVWKTVGDERVRDTHDYLENQSVNIDENFFTYDGDQAPCPGRFSKAENNVNCRCSIVLKDVYEVKP